MDRYRWTPARRSFPSVSLVPSLNIPQSFPLSQHAMTMSQLDIRTLSRMLLRTSTSRLHAIDELEQAQLSLLEMFLPDPDAFCDLLTETASVITGEAALWFMMRDDHVPKPSSLTVCCPRHRFDTVFAFLTQLPGASVHPYGEDLFQIGRAHV